MKILIFIPARGGSKAIPGKNLVELKGKPLIQHTLETAKELMRYDIHEWIPFTSTDDFKIAAFCDHHGYKMGYKRPKELAVDNSLIIDSIFDSLKWLEKNKNIIPDSVLLLQPTSPLRRTSDIINAIKKVENEKDFSIVSVNRMREHPYECVVGNNKNWAYLSKPHKKMTCRQDYDNNYFFINGNFYFASVDFLKSHQNFILENKTRLYILDQRWAIDIDEEEDLLVAKALA